MTTSGRFPGATAAGTPRSMLDRLAAAPISWGVCEVPGWGHQLPPERVLGEMRELGVAATEFGPDGFLPDDPAARAAMLALHRLRAVGGFVPVVLHDPDHDPVPRVDRTLDGFVAAGADVLVLAAATGRAGYDSRPELDEVGWRTLLCRLDRIAERAAERGVRASLHPHVGTMIETDPEVRRVLDGCDVPLCLDTGHLLIGGTDPVALTREAPGRIAHIHLKDVDAGLTARVRAGEIGYTDAVRDGIYRPLGQGDIDIADIVSTLEGASYPGWYVMEQDTILTAGANRGAGSREASRPGLGTGADEGPKADVRASIDYLRGLR